MGENRTFMGEEALLAERGVRVTVLDDETCVAMMRDFIEAEPDLWNEDIGRGLGALVRVCNSPRVDMILAVM